LSTAENSDPTMEEILASIRRIIEDEQDGDGKPKVVAAPAALRSAAVSAPQPVAFEDDDEEDLTSVGSDVLELSAIGQSLPKAQPDEPLISDSTEGLATSKLSELSGLLVRGYPGSENTLEGLVREMLRPMLKDWLDGHLPDLVEQMVAREIARISGRAR
jgi:uncharacterized protein